MSWKPFSPKVLPWRRATASVVALHVTLATIIGGAACRRVGVDASVGDSLLDVIGQEHVESFPATNLSPEVLEAFDGPLNMRTRKFAAAEWKQEEPIPGEAAEALGPDTTVRLWRLQLLQPLQPPLELSPDAPPPTVYLNEVRVEPWDPSTDPFPGLATWYEAESGSLYALSELEPVGVSLEYAVESQTALAPYEKLLGNTQTFRSSTGERVPALEELRARYKLGKVTRPGLLLPAGASLALPFDPFPAAGLSVAVGVIDLGYDVDRRDGTPVLVTAKARSDGVDFVVEVIEGAEVHEVWRHSLDRNDLRSGYAKAHVDLSAFRGKRLTLRLRTGPGPAGDTSFDYGVWGDLRLLAAAPQEITRPHVVLIDIDTLRADRLSCYGYERATTPRIDAWFARGGTRYEDATAPASWTLPSTASMLTGLAPHQHLVLDHGIALPSGVATLATLLRESGYQTYGDVEGGFMGPGFGMNQGFDEHQVSYNNDDEIVFARWSMYLDYFRKNLSGRPIFLFLHSYLVHAPYKLDLRFDNPSRPYQRKLAGQSLATADIISSYLQGELILDATDLAYINGLYDAGVTRMDGQVVGPFLEALDETLKGQEALVILTSDHGEEFFEHGGFGHGHSLYNELLRVPMLVRFPVSLGKQPAVSQVPVSLLDLVPTVLALAGVQQPEGLPGMSLLSLPPDPRIRVSQANGLSAISYGYEKLVVGRASTPLREFGPIEYYRLDWDPGEQNDLHGEGSGDLDRLERSLQHYLEVFKVVSPGATQSVIGAEDAQALRALGYLGDQ